MITPNKEAFVIGTNHENKWQIRMTDQDAADKTQYLWHCPEVDKALHDFLMYLDDATRRYADVLDKQVTQ